MFLPWSNTLGSNETVKTLLSRVLLHWSLLWWNVNMEWQIGGGS